MAVTFLVEVELIYEKLSNPKILPQNPVILKKMKTQFVEEKETKNNLLHCELAIEDMLMIRGGGKISDPPPELL